MAPWYIAAMILVASPALAWEGFQDTKRNKATADAQYYETSASNFYMEEFEEEEAEASAQPVMSQQPSAGSYYTNLPAPDTDYRTQ